MPPLFIEFGNGFASTASVQLTPSANYPWFHGGQVNGLMITFEPDCPKTLRVRIGSGLGVTSLRPRLEP